MVESSSPINDARRRADTARHSRGVVRGSGRARKVRLDWIACIALVWALGAQAEPRGVSPYLPLKLSPMIERKVEQVLLLAGKPVMTRPIAAATVLEALPEVCPIDPLLCREVSRYLEPYMNNFGVTELRVALAASDSERDQPLVNARGRTVDSSWSLTGRAFYQPFDRLLFSAGAVAYDDRAEATGTMLSAGLEYVQLDIGYRDHWLSPFTDSSMLVSTQASTMPGVTLSSYSPLKFAGFTYEVFLAELSHSDRIAYQGGFTSGNPRLAGLHFQIEPVSGYALAVNRVLQFGGGERGGTSFGDFWDAIFSTGTSDNTGTDSEFGNQAAAITARMVFPDRLPLSIYFEHAGEDRSYSGQRRLGNASLSLGVDFPRLFTSFDLTYEVSDWQNRWYVHHIYRDGLTNEGNVIGHWFGDNRAPDDAVGGQSHMLRIGKRFAGRSYGQLTYRTLQNEDYSAVQYDRMQELSLEYQRPWGEHVIGTGLVVGHDVFGDDYAKLEGSIYLFDNWLLDGAEAAARDRRRDGQSNTEFFVDIGASSGTVDAYLSRAEDFDADGNPIWRHTSYSAEPHVGIGLRRKVTDVADLGARLEWDRIGGYDMLSIRALDYRRRFRELFAVTAFLGASRYDLATAAYGYYIGFGAQFRNLLSHFDLSLDYRYYDKIARDKLLPSDPPPIATNNDMFFDVDGFAAYLSYRF